MSEDISIIKLVNGEEIIGKVEIEGGVVMVKDALQIMLVPQGNNQMGMGMAPYMPYAAEFLIYATAMVAVATPGKEILDSYNRHFSKIVMPPSGIVMESM